MSLPSVKWIPGAPKRLKVGMVLKAGSRVFLVGSPMVGDSMEFSDGFRLDGQPVDSYGQLVDAYVLEWLGSDGIVKGGVEMSKPDWKDAPEWANVLVSQRGFKTTVYCWASGFHDDARARWNEDPPHMEFKLFKSCWDLFESRP